MSCNVQTLLTQSLPIRRQIEVLSQEQRLAMIAYLTCQKLLAAKPAADCVDGGRFRARINQQCGNCPPGVKMLQATLSLVCGLLGPSTLEGEPPEEVTEQKEQDEEEETKGRSVSKRKKTAVKHR
jgi:hypothetical protein